MFVFCEFVGKFTEFAAFVFAGAANAKPASIAPQRTAENILFCIVFPFFGFFGFVCLFKFFLNFQFFVF